MIQCGNPDIVIYNVICDYITALLLHRCFDMLGMGDDSVVRYS